MPWQLALAPGYYLMVMQTLNINYAGAQTQLGCVEGCLSHMQVETALTGRRKRCFWHGPEDSCSSVAASSDGQRPVH